MKVVDFIKTLDPNTLIEVFEVKPRIPITSNAAANGLQEFKLFGAAVGAITHPAQFLPNYRILDGGVRIMYEPTWTKPEVLNAYLKIKVVEVRI